MDALGPRFERFLAAVEPDRAGRVIACEAITGGYSRISARARVRWGDGAEETFILRGDPPPGSGVFTSDRDAEWDLLSALPSATSVSTPVARWYDRSGEHLGTKAIVMDCATAVSLQDEMARAARVDTSSGPLADLFVGTFAAIHQTPLDALPDRMARPADGPAYLDGVLAQYDRIAHQYPDSAPVLRYVSWWARAHQPPPVPLGLVHGDCQPSNVLVGPAGPPLVIDWEFGHIGDPREDLGYYTQIPLEPNVYWADPERFLGAYARRVAARHGSAPLRAALAGAGAGPADSLHLADAADCYERAGQAFAAALAAAQEAGAADLVARAREVLRDRVATEKAVMATYAVVGR